MDDGHSSSVGLLATVTREVSGNLSRKTIESSGHADGLAESIISARDAFGHAW